MSRGDFWSRRKAAVAAERRAEAEAEEARRAEAEAQAAEEALAEKSDAEICAHFGLPDPDDLKPGDAVAGFMRREIPERLRRRALRKLWGSNPVLACLDGLNDYDDDYTNAATDAPGVKTAYQVGRGLRRHVAALEEAAAREADAASESPAETAQAHAGVDAVSEADAPQEKEESGSDHLAESTLIAEKYAGSDMSLQDEADAAAASATKVAVEPASPAETLDADEAEMRPAPRRMRFRFDAGGSSAAGSGTG